MLTEQQINDFNRDGYVLVPGLFGPGEMNEITAWTDEIANYPELPRKMMMYFEESKLDPSQRILCRIEDIEPFHKGFSKLFNGGKIHRCTAQLFSEEAILFKDKINFKLPGGAGFKAHQDIQAGWDSYATLHITALVTIDSCTHDNGCLEMAPDHHTQGLIGKKWQPLVEDALDYVSLPTAPGDTIFFDSFTPHRSAANLTSDPRRVLYITYNRLAEGDHRRQYYIDKRKSYPPDCERNPDQEYNFRV